MQDQTPYVGMPVTICFINDHYPGKVIKVSAGKNKIVVRSSLDVVYTLRKDGKYRRLGGGSGASYLRLGVAETYFCREI